jgi:hypothetical protein
MPFALVLLPRPKSPVAIVRH